MVLLHIGVSAGRAETDLKIKERKRKMELSKEIIAKARACKTEEELKALAKENGIEIPDEEVKQFVAENAEGELADDELEAVSGGRACKRNAHDIVYWRREEDVQFIFNVGDVVQAFIGLIHGSQTATVRITDRKKWEVSGGDEWIDVYKYDRISGSPTNLGFSWQNRNRFEK